MLKAITPFAFALKSPSKKVNLRRLKKRGEAVDSFTIRDAVVADVAALSALHVKVFNQTHRLTKNPPTQELREFQWREQFEANIDNWFCLVIENTKGQLIGFAKGMAYAHPNQPAYAGELNKIYLLNDYQCLGLGRRLICAVADRFTSKGTRSMLLFGDATSPSNNFYIAMGGERLYAKNGEFYGGYGWPDHEKLTANCKK